MALPCVFLDTAGDHSIAVKCLHRVTGHVPKGLRHVDARRVLAAVHKEPGSRERRVAEISGLSITVVRGHLRTFVEARTIRAVEDATSRRYFPIRPARP